MTRDEYLMQKQNRQIDPTLAYQFYCNVDSTRDKLSFTDFSIFLPQYIAGGGTMDKYYLYFDKQFGLISRNQNGDILI